MPSSTTLTDFDLTAWCGVKTPSFSPSRMGLDYHKKWFEALANRLGPYTRRCVVSILDIYKQTECTMAGLGIKFPEHSEASELLSHFTKVMAKRSISVESCSEGVDYSASGVYHGKCIDDRLISKLRDMPFDADKDKTQRAVCGCIPAATSVPTTPACTTAVTAPRTAVTPLCRIRTRPTIPSCTCYATAWKREMW